MSNRRGSVLALSLVMLLLVFSLAASLLAIASARCTAITKESRRAQTLALAESAIAAIQTNFKNGQYNVQGTLATGSYAAQAKMATNDRVNVTATGKALPLIGKTVSVQLNVTLARQGNHWKVIRWQELAL